MGRKSTVKSKEKRLQRKEEQQRISQAMGVVNQANKLGDPLEPFPVFKRYNKNGIDSQLYIKRLGDLGEDIKEWIFALTKKNMQIKYDQCSWGWNDVKKREELLDESAWYLIAQAVDGTLLGFAHFRFDLDEGIEVLYCYELQLESLVQRKGLGKFMMQILELVGFTNNMKKVVLTVLKNNQNAKFFKAINYDLDDSSPVDDEDETYPYEILSKVNKRLANTLPQKNHQHSNGHCCSGGHHHHHPTDV